VRTCALVVGYGSIGQRHARILKSLGCETIIVSRRALKSGYKTLRQAFQTAKPDYVVITNETSAHRRTLEELATLRFKGPVLVEKPLFDRPVNGIRRPKNVFVGYNMRFYPLVARLRGLLKKEKAISARVYVGQYLPDWRPERDYRKSYSSRRSAGGGVLRDLSHEIDYCGWIFGRCKRLAAVGGHYSHLKIDSDDAFSLLMATERCPAVSIQMNYLDRVLRREIAVVTDRRSYRADLVSGRLEIDGRAEFHAMDRDETFRAQHRAALKGRRETLCSFDEGAETLRVIQMAEKASKKGVWIR